jgi:hypothetical protein
MPEDNRTFIEKAQILVADFTDKGYLQTAQADEFIRLAIKDPILLQKTTAVPMKAMKEQRDKLRFSSRVLRRGAEATALPKADWAKPELSMVELDAKLFKAEVRLSDESLEDQIEGEKFQDTIMEELSKAIGRDMEWVGIQGTTTSTDNTLSVLDGVLKQITSNLVDVGSNKLAKAYLRDMLRKMPDEFINQPGMSYHTNRQAVLDYKDEIASRATPGGDEFLLRRKDAIYNDYDVVAVPEFPVASNNTQCLLGDPSGIMLGIWRQIKLKVGEDISEGIVKIVVSMRWDIQVMEQKAWVKGYDIKGN